MQTHFQVTLTQLELNALLELASLASPRLSTAEALLYDQLLTRMQGELAEQQKPPESIPLEEQLTQPETETATGAELGTEAAPG